MDTRNSILETTLNAIDALNLDGPVSQITDAVSAVVSQTLDMVENTSPGASQLSLIQLLGSDANGTALLRNVSGFAEFPDIAGTAGLGAAAVFEDISEGVGAAIDAAFADFKEDGVLSEPFSPRNPDAEPRTDAKVYVVNGIRQTHDDRVRQAEDTANLYGTDVQLVHNSSGGKVLGLITDSFEYLGETFLGIPSPSTQTLSDEIYNNLTQKPEPQKMEIMAYSQGSSQTALATSMAIARMKADGMSDADIKKLISGDPSASPPTEANLKIIMVGTPVDTGNWLQTNQNIPPGLGIPQQRLDYYFTTEDHLLQGTGSGEGYYQDVTIAQHRHDPNLITVRHEKDFVATSVHDLGSIMDVKTAAELFVAPSLILFDPTWSGWIAFRVGTFVSQLVINQAEMGSIAGYHDYTHYYNYAEENLFTESSYESLAPPDAIESNETLSKQEELARKKSGPKEPLS